MKQTDFLNKVAENAGLYKYQAKMFWDAFVETFIDTLNSGEKVKLHRFGTFSLKEMEGHYVGNPLKDDGDPIYVPTLNRLYFRPGEPLKRKLNSKETE